MKRPTLTVVTPVLIAFAIAVGGCGDEPAPDPETVIENAFTDGASAGEPAEATVEVASLGFEDRILESRLLEVDPETYAAVRDAITGNGSAGDGGGGRSGGLLSLAGDLESTGPEDLEGVEVDHVSGVFDVKTLIDELGAAADGSDVASASLPGLGDLDQLRQTLVAADFDLYAQTGNDSFERLDLTLSLDDRQNASPPTRIRFSLSESEQEQAPG